MPKLTDDQQEVIDALQAGSFKEVQPSNASGNTYSTFSGIEFTWLHGLGDGKDVTILDQKQPEWFAKQVRELLNDSTLID